MNRIISVSAIILISIVGSLTVQAKVWTLKDCIEYAIQNNITIRKTSLQHQSAIEDVHQSQANLLPSLSATTSQFVTYNPWPESGSYTVAGDKVQMNVKKVYYNGTYGVNTSWTVWNGNRNRDQVKANQFLAEKASLDSATTAATIQQQIAQLYIQIIYSKEAIEVNRQTLETSKKNEQRGQEFVNVGKMSKADLAQLTSQRAQDEYNLVLVEGNYKDFIRQLKKLLQITDQEPFDVVIPETSDEMALQDIPSVTDVYESALNHRPEIKNYMLGIESSNLQIKMAKAMKLPTVTASAGLSTNTTSISSNAYGKQLKNNFGLGGGFNVNIPLVDNRQKKTAVNKAILTKQDYELGLRDQQTTLYSTIENFWLQAINNQAQYRSARVSTQSAQTSYNLLNEQFEQNLKNIIELMNGKDALMRAQQAELQAKYLTILNIDLLKFYQIGTLK